MRTLPTFNAERIAAAIAGFAPPPTPARKPSPIIPPDARIVKIPSVDPYAALADRMIRDQTPRKRGKADRLARKSDRVQRRVEWINQSKRAEKEAAAESVWKSLRLDIRVRPSRFAERIAERILRGMASPRTLAALLSLPDGLRIVQRIGIGSMRRAAARYDARPMVDTIEDATQTYLLTLLAWVAGSGRKVEGFMPAPRKSDGTPYSVGQFLASHGAKSLRHAVRFASRDSNRRPRFQLSGRLAVPGVKMGILGLTILATEPTAVGGPTTDDTEVELSRMQSEIGSTAADVARLMIRGGFSIQNMAEALFLSRDQVNRAVAAARQWYTKRGLQGI